MYKWIFWCLTLILWDNNVVKSEFSKLDSLYEWNKVEFAWPSDEIKAQAVSDGSYIEKNNAILALEPYRNEKLFLTIPRWVPGVAASLAYVRLNEKESENKSPVLHPYPNWEAHTVPKDGETPQDNQLVSVFRARVDKCDRLWVLDKGEENTSNENPRQVRDPAIIIYDLKTDEQIRRYDLKQEHFDKHSFYANIIVDDSAESCDQTYAYLYDNGNYQMVVYSFADNDSWKIVHPTFSMEPHQCRFNAFNVSWKWTDGIFGAALGPPDLPTGQRKMYFHALCGNYEYVVSTSVLQNKTLATDLTSNYDMFHIVGYRGPNTQSSTSDLDTKTGVIFFTMLTRNGFACWNSKKPMNPENVIMAAQNNETLIYTNEVRLDQDRNLYILSNQMPIFLYGTLDPNDPIYRIYRAPVDRLIEDTACSEN